VSSEPAITLQVLEETPGLAVGIYRPDQFPFTLGRDEDCHLVLPLPMVSRVHAQIERYPSGYLLRDLNTPNGTFVNEVRILQDTPRRLRDGDFIGLGSPTRMLRYRDPQETVEAVDLRLSDTSLQAYWGDELIPLEPRQVQLLKLLWTKRGKVCTDQECEAAVWGEDRQRDEKQAAPNISGIVTKLNQELRARYPTPQPPIERVRNIGYKLTL
jgi:pSer/pThr/pTyr-binding forkhead associated (FHA) protein